MLKGLLWFSRQIFIYHIWSRFCFLGAGKGKKGAADRVSVSSSEEEEEEEGEYEVDDEGEEGDEENLSDSDGKELRGFLAAFHVQHGRGSGRPLQSSWNPPR